MISLTTGTNVPAPRQLHELFERRLFHDVCVASATRLPVGQRGGCRRRKCPAGGRCPVHSSNCRSAWATSMSRPPIVWQPAARASRAASCRPGCRRGRRPAGRRAACRPSGSRRARTACRPEMALTRSPTCPAGGGKAPTRPPTSSATSRAAPRRRAETVTSRAAVGERDGHRRAPRRRAPRIARAQRRAAERAASAARGSPSTSVLAPIQRPSRTTIVLIAPTRRATAVDLVHVTASA